ncbi:MAG: RNA polymerase-binding protein DksA [Legionellales bacterium]|nr:RNA polymerase-binding protein DksA [Legionellales bacterium]|tara:strand:- start:4936 stop:5352 length:417 start_codon:yes stop_codon:yes gene_type:complete
MTETKPATEFKLKRGEEYMSPRMRAHLKDKLLEMKRDIMEEVDHTIHDMRDEDSRPSDFTDRATREEEMGLMLRTRDREGKLLKKVEEAIDLVDTDDYGYCEACGVEIGLPRLDARPTATLCIDCKTLAEIKEKQQQV